MAYFGNGATFRFTDGTTDVNCVVKSIGSLSYSNAVADITPLATGSAGSFRRKLVSYLSDVSELEITFYHDPTDDIPQPGVVGTFTIDYPGNLPGVTGEAAIMGASVGDITSDEVVESTLTIQIIEEFTQST